jgi:hypothetical protein
MRRLVLFLTLTSFLCAQDVEDGAVDDVPPSAEAEAMPPPPAKTSTDTRNWIFAAGSIVAATIAIVVVSLNPGASPSHSK